MDSTPLCLGAFPVPVYCDRSKASTHGQPSNTRPIVYLSSEEVTGAGRGIKKEKGGGGYYCKMSRMCSI